MHGGLELAVALPVAVRLLHHDLALDQQPVQDLPHVEIGVPCIADADGNVLEVAIKRQVFGWRHVLILCLYHVLILCLWFIG